MTQAEIDGKAITHLLDNLSGPCRGRKGGNGKAVGDKEADKMNSAFIAISVKALNNLALHP